MLRAFEERQRRLRERRRVGLDVMLGSGFVGLTGLVIGSVGAAVMQTSGFSEGSGTSPIFPAITGFTMFGVSIPVMVFASWGTIVARKKLRRLDAEALEDVAPRSEAWRAAASHNSLLRDELGIPDGPRLGAAR